MLAREGYTFTLGGLTLNGSAVTDFQLGALTGLAVINITNANAFSLGGLSTVNISNPAGGLTAGTYRLFNYTGNALGSIANLQLGSTPGLGFTYSLSNNTTHTSVDLLVSLSNVQWANDASGVWNTAGNWTNNSVPNSAGAQANFFGVINSARTVTVDGAFTIGTMTFDSLHAYTIAPDNEVGSGLTFDNAGTASISVLRGSHILSAPVALANNLEIAAVSGAALTISGEIYELSAARTVTLNGVGSVTFAGGGANAYTGLTTVNAGVLNLGKTAGVNAIGSGGVQIGVGATVALLASNQIADTAALTANGTFALGTNGETIGALNGGGAVTLGAGSLLTVGASNNLGSQFDGVISGEGTIAKSGTGTWILSGPNTFGGAGQTVTINAGSLQIASNGNLGNAANSLTFNGGSLLLGGALVSGRNVVLNGSGDLNTNNNAASLSGVVSGAGGLTKSGAGTLTLSGANTYSGGTILNAGTLSISSDTNLGAGSLQLNNGATLLTNGSFSFTHGFVLGAPTGPVQADGLAISGIINVQSGTLTETTNGITDGGLGGRLMKIGPGTLDLQVGGPASGGNTAFSGGIYIHEGTLKISTITSGGSNTTATIDNGATLLINSSSGGVRGIGQFRLGTGGALVGETAGNTSFANGVISNVSGQSGGITFIGPGKNGLGGNNTFSGTVVIGDPATPLVPAILSISRDVNLGAASNQLSIGNGSTLMIEDGIDATQPVGSAAVAGTFSTGRQINLIGSTATIDVRNTGDAVNYNPAFNPGGLNVLAAHTNVLTVNGVVTGSGQLTKAGDGTLVLANPGNTYTGGTVINAGMLSVADSSALGAATTPLTINATAIYQATGTFSTVRAVTLGGSGGISGGGTFDVTSTNNETRTGAISGTGSLTKTGTGTLSLFGVSDYTGGTFINAGTVAISNSFSLGAVGGSATIGDATLAVASDVTSNRAITLGHANSVLQVDAGTTYTLGGVLSGAGALNKSGDGVLALNGSNTYTGGTIINAGTVIVNSATNLGNGGPLTVNAGTLAVATGYSTNRNTTLGHAASTILVDPAQTYTLTGVVSGSGTLNKMGTGNLTLTGANTFSGETVVEEGTLTVASGSGNALANTTAITVNDGGTLLLGASNQIGNATPVNLGGGTLAKGNFSEGAANLVGMGALTLTATGSSLDFGTGTVGILSFASFNPGLDLDAFLTILNWTGTANAVGGGSTDRLIFNTTQAGNLGYFNFAGFADGARQFDLGGGFYEVTPVTPVPEPGTYAAGALALAAIVFSQRRRLRRPSASAPKASS